MFISYSIFTQNSQLLGSLLTGLWWRGWGNKGSVWQQVFQVFHDLVGAVCVVPPVLLFIPSLENKICVVVYVNRYVKEVLPGECFHWFLKIFFKGSTNMYYQQWCNDKVLMNICLKLVCHLHSQYFCGNIHELLVWYSLAVISHHLHLLLQLHIGVLVGLWHRVQIVNGQSVKKKMALTGITSH